MQKKLSLLISLVLLVALSGPAKAEPLDVPNFSFEYGYENPEEPNDTDPCTWVQLLGHTGIEGVAAWQTGEGSDGYIGVDVNCDVCSPAPEEEECKTWFTATDEFAVCYMQHTGSIMYQLLDHTVVEGELYTLKWDGMGWANDMVASLFYFEYDEVNDVNVPVYIASDVFTLDPKDPDVYNDWLIDLTTWGVVLPGSDAAGKQLGIEFNAIGSGGYGFVENVRLDCILANSAYHPNPANGAVNVGLETPNLSWEPGIWAQPEDAHDVYFGTSFEDVNDATPGNPLDVYKDRFDANSWPIDITLEIAQTYYWRVDEFNSTNSASPWKGKIWSFKANDGTAAFPKPFDGERDVDPEVVLSWTPGIAAVSHDVYFGTSFDDVNEATTADTDILKSYRQTTTTYDPDALTEPELKLGVTYYWRIDEINEAHPSQFWKGKTWRFTVSDYHLIDDFEGYGGSTETLRKVWHDSYITFISGATVWDESETVRDKRSMKYRYCNYLEYDYWSEAHAHTYQGSGSPGNYLLYGPDWKANGIESLALWFYGKEDNATGEYDRMSVGLSDGTHFAQVQYYGNPNDVRLEKWQEWNIGLEEFTDDNPLVNLSNIEEIYIIFGERGNDSTAGGEGYVWFDDVRLYPSRCVPKLAYKTGSFDGDCVTDYSDLAMMSDDWLLSGRWVAPEAQGEPIVQYTFDEDKDTYVLNTGSEGSAYNGQYGPDPCDPAWTEYGHTGGSLVLDNEVELDGEEGDFVSLPALNLNSNTVSITVWIKRDTEQVIYAPVVFTRGYAQDHNDPNDTLPESTTTVGLGLGSTVDDWEVNNELCYHWADAENSWSWHNGLIVPDGVWTFIALTVAPDVASLYMSDGTTIKAARNFAYHEPEKFDGLIYLGWDRIGIDPYEPTNDRHFSGVIDDVRIYDYTLTPGEVLGIAGLSGTHYLPLEPWCADTDKDDNKVDLIDYAVLADYWLEETLFPIP